MHNEELYEQSKIELGEEMLKKHRIYLDTNYWINMSNASIGKASPRQVDIFNILKMLVRSNIAICPLSPHVHKDLINYGNEQGKLQIAKVMDELSQQITFLSPLSIAGQELILFIRNSESKVKGNQPYTPAKYVWRKTEDISGEFHTKNSEDLIARLNHGKDENQDWKTFHEVFMLEITGSLDVLKDDIDGVWEFLDAKNTGHAPSWDETVRTELVKQTRLFIYAAFDQKKINKELPWIHIGASIHALFRYNKSQRFKPNDLTDISHAQWALPYCDAFLTETSLAHWICDKPLALHEIYGTKVIYDEDSALEYLSGISSKLTN